MDYGVIMQFVLVPKVDCCLEWQIKVKIPERDEVFLHADLNPLSWRYGMLRMNLPEPLCSLPAAKPDCVDVC
jgi:hypothetical protein